jgi:flagellar biosynthesis/type III secretory pathway chaperone
MSPITTAAEAEQAIDTVAGLIEKLASLIEQETRLVHAGKIRTVTDLGAQKSQLAGELYSSSERLRANAKFLTKAAPERCALLARVQEGFRAVLQRNLIVLATTHSVSEGIMRRLSGDIARKTAPQVYGASGRTNKPHPRYGQPLAISRKL